MRYHDFPEGRVMIADAGNGRSLFARITPDGETHAFTMKRLPTGTQQEAEDAFTSEVAEGFMEWEFDGK